MRKPEKPRLNFIPTPYIRGRDGQRHPPERTMQPQAEIDRKQVETSVHQLIGFFQHDYIAKHQAKDQKETTWKVLPVINPADQPMLILVTDEMRYPPIEDIKDRLTPASILISAGRLDEALTRINTIIRLEAQHHQDKSPKLLPANLFLFSAQIHEKKAFKTDDAASRTHEISLAIVNYCAFLQQWISNCIFSFGQHAFVIRTLETMLKTLNHPDLAEQLHRAYFDERGTPRQCIPIGD